MYVQDTYYIDVQAFTYTNVMTYAARINVARRLLQDDFLANLISAQLSRPMRHRWFIDRVRIIGHTVDFIRDFVIRVNSHSKHAQSRNTIHSNCPSKHKLTKSMPKRSTTKSTCLENTRLQRRRINAMQCVCNDLHTNCATTRVRNA